jgi:hypothetical protein
VFANHNYNVRQLTPERIPEAFPVVAVLDEQITAERWYDYARAIVGPDGRSENHGILTLEDRQGCIMGLSVYVIRPDLWRGRVLVIENFAIVTLIGTQQAASVLLAAIEHLARDRACQCLAVSLLERTAGRSPDQNRGLTGRFFKGAGFRLDLARLSKCLEPTAPDRPGAAGAHVPLGYPGLHS